MNRKQISATVLAAGLMLALGAVAEDFGPGGYDLSWNTIDGGGGTSTGGSFELSGTIGQPDASTVAMTGGGFELSGGFWPGAGSTPPVNTCPADIAPPGGDGVVGVPDLLKVISSWGPCPAPPNPCVADIAPPGGDNTVGVPDLLKVISSWGGCP